MSYASAAKSGLKTITADSYPRLETPKVLTKLPEIPAEWRSVDSSLLGTLPLSPPSLPGPEEAVQGKENARKNAERYIFRFGLENKRGECFRNAGLTCLLHTPVFYNFLIGHCSDPPACSNSSDCLTCLFQDVARHYYPAVSPNRATLYTALDDFFQKCRREFWGPHSKLKKERPETQVKPDDDPGGQVDQFVPWLIYFLERVAHKISRNGVDESRLLKAMFWTTFIAHKTCANNHRKFLWRKERNWLQIGSKRPAPDSVTVEEGLKTWFTDLAGSVVRSCDTVGCSAPETSTASVRIGQAPEILLIRAPGRRKTEAESDYFFRVPFARTIDLSTYAVKPREVLKYRLQSMCLKLGYGYRTKGHVVSVVQAADGKVYKIDNQDVQLAVSPGPFVNRAQSAVFEKDQRLLPCFFVYVREREGDANTVVPTAARSGKKRRVDVDGNVVERRKRVRR
jgi:hypothetical protein